MGSRGGLNGRFWALGVGLLVVVGAGAGLGGYELGLRANRTSQLSSSVSPLPTSTSPTSGPASSAADSPTPAPFPTLAGAAVIATNLHCKLPVYLPGKDGSGAFINFPAGTVTPDQSSMVTAPGGDWFGLTYDNSAHRWLPVPYPWVTADGALYAYAADPMPLSSLNPLTEVNVQTGNSAILQQTSPINGNWQVIAVSPDYVSAINPQTQGLYSVPLSGPWNNENYVSDGFWTAASGFYAYGSATPDGGAIVRVDARDQTQHVPWFRKSSSAQIIGFDGTGNPVIWTGTDLWIAYAPDQSTRVGALAPVGTPQQGVYGSEAPVLDAHGLWLSSTDGIYLYAGGKATKVSNVVAQVAGRCT